MNHTSKRSSWRSSDNVSFRPLALIMVSMKSAYVTKSNNICYLLRNPTRKPSEPMLFPGLPRINQKKLFEGAQNDGERTKKKVEETRDPCSIENRLSAAHADGKEKNNTRYWHQESHLSFEAWPLSRAFPGGPTFPDPFKLF